MHPCPKFTHKETSTLLSSLTIDVLTANKMIEISSILKLYILHDYQSSSHYNRINKLDRDYSLANFITCLPPEMPPGIAFIPSIPKHVLSQGL